MACESVSKSQGIPCFNSEPRLKQFKEKLRCDIKLLTEIPKREPNTSFCVHLETSKGDNLRTLADEVHKKFQEMNIEGQFAILVSNIEDKYHTVGYVTSEGSRVINEPYEIWTLYAYILKKS